MLAGLVEYLSEQKHSLTLIARSSTPLSELEGVNFIAFDYTERSFPEMIKKLYAARPFTSAIVWMHSSGDQSLLQLLDFFQQNKVKVFHVKGSRFLTNTFDHFDRFKEHLFYHDVKLGHMKEEGNAKRWLTDQEISEGVIHAVRKGLRSSTVGQI